ncbi:protein ripply2-like [Sardina pilchardus]|uniref:protein ripply2-like n=1 Tax=Sardina pilchardus TaxID=27697 RepID=UPI002E1265FF
MEITMNSFLGQTGYNNESTTHEPTQERALFWRPWTQKELEQRSDSHGVYGKSLVELSDPKKPNSFVHPVKLFWPRSRCYDYLYQDAEALLRNYPFQATVCLYADSSDEEDSDEEVEKEMN